VKKRERVREGKRDKKVMHRIDYSFISHKMNSKKYYMPAFVVVVASSQTVSVL
jgi:hypothetical protein